MVAELPRLHGQVSFLVAVAVMGLSPFTAHSAGTSIEDLLANLTRRPYSRSERPDAIGQATEVALQIYLSSIVSIDQRSAQIEVAGYSRQFWRDSRLAYTSVANGGNFDEIVVSSGGSFDLSKFWQPDIYFDNSIRENTGASSLTIYPSGQITKSSKITHTFQCTFDFSSLPFDSQTCRISLASYGFDSNQLVTKAVGVTKGLTKMEDYKGTDEWEIGTLLSPVETRWFNFPGGPRPWTYVLLDIGISRRPGVLVRSILLPSVLFVMLSYCGFFISRKIAPARVAQSVLPVLIMLNLISNVNSMLPPVAYSTWLTSYLVFSLIMTVSSVLEFAFVSYLLHMEEQCGEKLVAVEALCASLKLTDMQALDDVTHRQTYLNSPPPNRLCFWRRSSRVVPTGSQSLSDRTLVNIFKVFDSNRSGSFDPKEARYALRSFGQYFSECQVREIFTKVGVDIENGEDMDFGKFAEWMTGFDKSKPTKDIHRSFWDQPPSLQADIVMRCLFLTVFVVVSLSFCCMIPTL